MPRVHVSIQGHLLSGSGVAGFSIRRRLRLEMYLTVNPSGAVSTRHGALTGITLGWSGSRRFVGVHAYVVGGYSRNPPKRRPSRALRAESRAKRSFQNERSSSFRWLPSWDFNAP